MNKYLNELKEGDQIQDVYLCKQRQSAVAKNGKAYENVVLQDRTGLMDAKIWEPNSGSIGEFEPMSYIFVSGTVSSYNGQMQASLKQVRKAEAGEYNPADYVPVTKKITREMYHELLGYAGTVKNPYLQQLLYNFFVDDREFIHSFARHSAAKTVHHGFVGGLLEHTVAVTKIAAFMADMYPAINRDILITAALLHDIGKTRELSLFPMNDYTDDGQLIGHIVIGAEMVHDKASAIEGFPPVLEMELKHCILSHHGEYEYGSPKKPAMIEAIALHRADDMDAKMQTMTEALENAGEDVWLGYSRFFETNIRKTENAGLPEEVEEAIAETEET